MTTPIWTKPTRRTREFRFNGGLTPAVLQWAINRFAYERGARPRKIHLHPKALESYFDDVQWFRRYRVTAWRPYRWYERMANAVLGVLGRPSLKQRAKETMPVLASCDLIVDYETEPQTFRLE